MLRPAYVLRPKTPSEPPEFMSETSLRYSLGDYVNK